MLSENLKRLRKAKGLTQEELAERLHVVRQTVSKWEKGTSVPDAELLIRLSEIFEVPVSTLLGGMAEEPETQNDVAVKLEQLNALLAERNRRSRRIWRVVATVLIVLAVLTAVTIALAFLGSATYLGETSISCESSLVTP